MSAEYRTFETLGDMCIVHDSIRTYACYDLLRAGAYAAAAPLRMLHQNQKSIELSISHPSIQATKSPTRRASQTPMYANFVCYHLR